MFMFGRHFEVYTCSRFWRWNLINICVIWTQPLGPLCLWQCFNLFFSHKYVSLLLILLIGECLHQKPSGDKDKERPEDSSELIKSILHHSRSKRIWGPCFLGDLVCCELRGYSRPLYGLQHGHGESSHRKTPIKWWKNWHLWSSHRIWDL